MLRSTLVCLKKGWTHSPGRTRRGGKNLAWRPKIAEHILNQFVPLNMAFPRRHPNSWQELQFNSLGYVKWPKDIGFYNAGDNFELTPEASWRLYLNSRDEAYWGPLHNEKTIVYLLPEVERSPAKSMERVNDVFRHHLRRYGADHYIYNAVMQASAFAKDFARCKQLCDEMSSLGLERNAQTFFNMMLASKLSGQPRETTEAFFREAVASGVLTAVLRLDTEFQMWMDQLDRMGSFTSKSGFLSVNEEGARPMPRDMFSIWGWHKSEAKFKSRDAVIREQVRDRVNAGSELIGTVYTRSLRRPWTKYNGMLPHDFKGPAYRPPTTFPDAPAADAQ